MKKIYLIIILVSGSVLSTVSADDNSLSLKQRILMPGPVIQGHAEFEADCESCHSSFDKKELSKNCLNCHEDIAEDRKHKRGFHGISPNAKSNPCQSCHTDHEGRDANILGLNIATFNHQHTNFNLLGTHKQLACDSCHKPAKKYREAEAECFACHKQDDPHKKALGEDCGSCHQADSWRTIQRFDHSKTDFALLGKHKEVLCMSCHLGERYEFGSTTCASCHLASDVHAGSNGDQCSDCHSEMGWERIKFDHSKNTDFPLTGGHKPLPCRACHSSTQVDKGDTPTTCNACHKNDDPHLGRNGPECEDCHNSKSWKKPLFDHNMETDFKLTGKHRELACTQCHVSTLKARLPLNCAGCHATDDIHNSEEMQICATCHNTYDWKKTTKFDHDFSKFPLIGMHAIVPCGNCHQNNHFAGTSTSCIDCHRAEDYHKKSLGKTCEQCHNPNGWGFWRFDHNAQTDFALDGSHKGLACNACHTSGSKAHHTNDECVDCHAKQDIHGGTFGDDCGKCHTTNRFSELLWIGG